MLITELIKLNNLQLAGKLVSDELMLGIQTSRRSGIGTEFEQFRHYTPGDDPKRIDWKLFAKTDHYLVRESATESNQQIRFLTRFVGFNELYRSQCKPVTIRPNLAGFTGLSGQSAGRSVEFIRPAKWHWFRRWFPPASRLSRKLSLCSKLLRHPGAWETTQPISTRIWPQTGGGAYYCIRLFAG